MRGDNFSINGAINVGALSNDTDEGKADFSNWGPGIDVYAAGETVMGAMMKDDITYGNPYYGQLSNTPKWDTMGVQNGTSYASPFIAGMLACLAEVYPTLTQAQARAYLQNNAVTGLMADTADAIDVDVSTRVSTDGSNIDRIALWKNHRQTSGNMAFNTYNKDVNDRPTSGLMYPRTRTRRHG
jgi:subtilisin family serine protease